MSRVDDIFDEVKEAVSIVLDEAREEIINFIEENYLDYSGDLEQLANDYLDRELVYVINDALTGLTDIANALSVTVTVEELR